VTPPPEAVSLSTDLVNVLRAHVATWPGRAACAVANAEVTVASAGPEEEVFEWASVTKLLVAFAVLVASEEGTVSLDEPAGPDGSTVAHLMAHASGLPFEGTSAVSPPGRRRIYSNSGVEALAAHLERRCGLPFADYLQEGVLGPLGMTSTTVTGSPAHAGRGPLSDLAVLARELIAPHLVGTDTWARATSVAFPGLAGVLPGFGRFEPCDWGLGPELAGTKSPHWTGSRNSRSTYGHFGQSGSFVWADPEAGIALAGLSTEPFGPWAKEAWPALSDAVLASLAGAG
jgi:CubicO group peptidase (beta-lactamase class C family)